MIGRLRRGQAVDLHQRHVGGHPGRGDASCPLCTVPAALIMRLLADPTAAAPGRAAVLDLRGAHVSGELLLRHATIGVPLRFENCVFDEPVELSQARAESLSFRDSTLPALAARGLRLDGDLDCAGVQTTAIDLFGARIGGQLWLAGAHVDAAPDRGWAVNAPSMVVAGGVYGRDLVADGGVNLYGTEIGAALELPGGTITAQDGPAVRAANLIARTDVHLNGASIQGGVDLFGARIGGQLWLSGAQVQASDGGWAVNAPSMDVAGGVYGRGLVARGGVNVYGTQVGAGVELDGATLAAEAGPALRGPHLSVGGDMTLTDNLTLNGDIDLHAAVVAGALTIAHAQLGDDQRCTVYLAAARLTTLRLDAIRGAKVSLDLRGATVTSLEDDPTCWPYTLRLDRLSYDTLHPPLPARQRLAWLARDPDAHHPQPYQQLAAHYRRSGQDHDARTVLLAKHRNQRRKLRLPARAWGYLQDITVGYGYRSARALGWLLALLAILATYTSIHPPRPAAGSSPSFNPVAYAIDVVLPILDLGQEKAYNPTGPGQWITWLATLAGWILATSVIAAISRTIARE